MSDINWDNNYASDMAYKSSVYSANKGYQAQVYQSKTQLKIAKMQLQFQYEQMLKIGIPEMEANRWFQQQQVKLMEDRLGFEKEQFSFERDKFERQFSESIRQFDLQFAEQQRQFNASTGMDALKVAASLTGPGDWAKELQYARGFQGIEGANDFLKALTDISGVQSAFQARAGTPEAATAQSLLGKLSGESTDWTSQSANANLGAISAIGQAGAHRLSPGSLESLDESERSFLFGGLGQLGYDVPRWIRDYYRSRLPGQDINPGLA